MNQTNHSKNLTKYRPLFTIEQMSHILSSMSGNDPIGKSVIKVLVPMLAKVEVGAINPAYKLSETHAAKLAEASERQRYENNLMSPEEEAEYESKVMGI